MSTKTETRDGAREGVPKLQNPFRAGGASRRLRRVLVALLWCGGASSCSLPSLNYDGDNPSPDGTFTDPTCKSDAEPLTRANYGVWNVVRLDDVVPGDDAERAAPAGEVLSACSVGVARRRACRERLRMQEVLCQVGE